MEEQPIATAHSPPHLWYRYMYVDSTQMKLDVRYAKEWMGHLKSLDLDILSTQWGGGHGQSLPGYEVSTNI